MSKPVFISICIPAYKRKEFLKRLLDSITIQTYQDYEVIVTDDSPDNEVEELCSQYVEHFSLVYKRNSIPLGTPENWNEAIRMAKGEWIKLMHDDDWFARPDSLQKFADFTRQHRKASFFFSAYNNVFESNGKMEEVQVNSFRWKALLKNSVTLFSKNIIGPPSVTLHKNNQNCWYDKKVKWVVDIDFYIRFLKNSRPSYIKDCLINVGINAEQVTQSSFRVAEVEIPENFYLLNKSGTGHLKNILVYDAWWRLMRNLKIQTEDDLKKAGYNDAIPIAIQSVIHWQNHIPASLLKMGIISKICMLLNYLRNAKRL